MPEISSLVLVGGIMLAALATVVLVTWILERNDKE